MEQLHHSHIDMNPMKPNYNNVLIAGSFLVLIATSPAPIKAASPNAIEEVVVTAERRTQSIQDVASSLGVISGESIEVMGIDDFLGYSRSQAGVVLHQAVKNRATWNIRGINTDIGDTQLTQEPVAVYINDMAVSQPYASLVQVDLRMYDIERIEILRGPQGTLFGSGTLGGLVRVLTKQPNLDEFEASMSVDLADVSRAGLRQRYDAMINVPLTETMAIRAVGSVRDEQGWVKNPVLGTENSSDDWNARVALLWQPNERFDLKLEAIHQDSDPEDGDAWNPDLGRFLRNTIVTEARQTIFSQFNATATYDFEEFATFTSSTNWQKTDSNWLLQAGEIPGIGTLLNQSDNIDTDFFSQEFRFVSNTKGRINWVAGAFYSDVKTSDATFKFVLDGLTDFADLVIAPGVVTSDTILTAPQSIYSTELAAYGDVTLNLNEKWSATVGLRAFEFESQLEDAGATVFDFASFQNFNLPPFENKASDSDLTWRGVLSYKPDDASHYYFNVSRGYRVGQINPNFGPSFVDPADIVIDESYDADQTINYELGLKKQFFDNRLALNAALYFVDWSDVQVDALRPSDQRNFIANAGDAESKGLELEAIFDATERLQMRLTASWQDAEIVSISALNSLLSGAQVGDDMPGSPDYMFSGQANYTTPLNSGADLQIYAVAQWVGESVNRFSNQAATGLPHPDFAINESYENVDVGATFSRDRAAFTLYVENLTNNDNIILDTGAVATASGENNYITLRPRTVGARFTYEF